MSRARATWSATSEPSSSAVGIGRRLREGHRGSLVIEGLVVLGPAGAPAADHVKGGGARRPIYVGRGDLADLLTGPLGAPQPDPDLLHHLVHIRVVQPIAAAHLADHRAESLEDRLDRKGKMLLGVRQRHAGSIELPGVRRQRPESGSFLRRASALELRQAAVQSTTPASAQRRAASSSCSMGPNPGPHPRTRRAASPTNHPARRSSGTCRSRGPTPSGERDPVGPGHPVPEIAIVHDDVHGETVRVPGGGCVGEPGSSARR